LRVQEFPAHHKPTLIVASVPEPKDIHWLQEIKVGGKRMKLGFAAQTRTIFDPNSVIYSQMYKQLSRVRTLGYAGSSSV
jgi:hypothetical protein